ncbi:MAG: VTT domain-containing protein [Acidobacteriota bacterium]
MIAIIDSLVRYGLPFVFLCVFIEQIGLPIPAVPVLVLAGALAADGRLAAPQALAMAVLASLIADSIWFWLGRRQGTRVLNTVCRISVSPDSCVRRMEILYERLGLRSLLFAKWVPGFSTVAPPLAGALRASPLGFLLWDAAGAAVWAGASIGAGMIFHRAVDRVLALVESLGYLGLGLLATALLGYIAWRFHERHRFITELRLSRITVDELRGRLAGTEDLPLIVDVRTRGARWLDARRIPGSLRLDFDEIEQHLADLPHDREVVLYCT